MKLITRGDPTVPHQIQSEALLSGGKLAIQPERRHTDHAHSDDQADKPESQPFVGDRDPGCCRHLTHQLAAGNGDHHKDQRRDQGFQNQYRPEHPPPQGPGKFANRSATASPLMAA